MTKMLFSAAIVTTAFMLTPGAQAQTPDILSDLYQCKTLSDNAARLACYDEKVGRVETAQETGELVAIDREAAEEIQRESIGFNIPSLPKINIFNRVNKDKATPRAKVEFDGATLNIKSTRIKADGKMRFYMDNGQIWDQSDTRRMRPFNKSAENTLVIEKAALGSFLARINGKGGTFRVRRHK